MTEDPEVGEILQRMENALNFLKTSNAELIERLRSKGGESHGQG